MSSKLELYNGKYIDDQMANGVPEGGTTGQLLAKATDADYDTEWVTGGGGGSGTVTSVQLTAGTGISLTGTNPITTSGNITITNSNPFTTPLTTKGDIYVRNGTGDTRLPVGLDTQVLLADSTASTGLKWGTNTTPPASGYYGAWQDNVTQTAAVNNTGYAMIFRTVDLSNGVTVVTNGTNLTRITFANTGVYNLQFSSQFQNLSNAPQDVTIWLRKNGTDISGTAGVVGMEARKNPGDPYHTIAGWNYLLDVIGGEYYELIWSTTDAANVAMEYYPAGSPPPSAASVIMTVTQQAGILAGTGITAINSLSGAVQTLGTGTSGTDFAISSSGTSHTFNLPTASASNRGALSSTDWSTFNGKQAALSGTGFVKISGTTISYDNSTYLTSAITSLNGLTGATQTFATGTTGTDFGISSSGTSHTFNLPTSSSTNRGLLSSTDWSTFNNKQSALTFSTGLTNTTGTITNNLSVGVSGGQSVVGGTAASNSLTLSSTSNATKGKLLFGTSGYDEVNNWMGLGTSSPSYSLDVQGSIATTAGNIVVLKNTNAALSTSPVLALDCSGTQPDQPVDIRLGSTQPKGLRIYASNADLTSTPAGAGFQFFSTSSTNFPGQIYFDSGSHNSASIIFRTAQTAGTIAQRMRIFANGNVSISSSTTDPGFLFNVAGTGKFTSSLTTAGRLSAFVNKTTTYTLTATDEVVYADATGGAFTVSLPTAGSKSGQTYTIKRANSGANNVTVGTTSSQTIDGSTTYVLSAQYKYVTVVSTGTNWIIIANN